jgi:hemerythrin-like domain-containing protein
MSHPHPTASTADQPLPTGMEADLTGYRAVHRALRTATRRLSITVDTIPVNDQRRVRALQRYWAGYAAEVLTHHTIEDEVFFPALADRSSSMAALAARLDADHQRLDELMARVAVAIEQFHDVGAPPRAATALTELADLMDEHLDVEDDWVLPLFTLHFTATEYAELEEQAFAAVGVGRQAMFAIPFVVRAMSAVERATALGAAPLPMRLLYALTRRSHERLHALVFGDEFVIEDVVVDVELVGDEVVPVVMAR